MNVGSNNKMLDCSRSLWLLKKTFSDFLEKQEMCQKNRS